MIVDCSLIEAEIDRRTVSLIHEHNDSRRASLAVVSFEGNDAGKSYSSAIARKAERLGIRTVAIHMPQNTQAEEIDDAVRGLCTDDSVDGILVQTPLPASIRDHAIPICVEKDVDCASAQAAGLFFRGLNTFDPATPRAVLEILRRITDLRGKHVVVLGRSETVGKPLACMLLRKGVDATVTVCHSRTADVVKHTSQADIIVCAIGVPAFLNAEMVRRGAVVIDVGINPVERNGKWRIVGDVDEGVASVAAALTPVPGGVGKITTSVLLHNVAVAYDQNLRSSRI